MGAFLFLLLLFIPPFLAMQSEKTPSSSGDDEVDFGDKIARGWMGDMSSSYYMMFDDEN